MFVCPYCGANARTRTSRRLSEFTIRQYHQCQNLECSESFTTLNTVERRVTKRSTSTDPLPLGFIPSDAFPASHYGNNQLSLAV
ncbi:ogr/Delta-like zinc finger family protein [Raoultella planticola]|uniref:ogr/Delta-like zinc finger family protein n=1 Tax=Raoultella planticola TaxID=575 RepID=UPI001F27605D|nr:ogr/Delta-like zinc finger family protein [Raoultella planticola]MCE9856956.1 ogr/Delta-like zinc finger family protein [Raoultella planticola]